VTRINLKSEVDVQESLKVRLTTVDTIPVSFSVINPIVEGVRLQGTTASNMDKKNESTITILKELFQTLDARKRPEDVAEMLLELLSSELSLFEIQTLEKAAQNSLKRQVSGYTSMLEDFIQPIGMERQIRTAETLFQSFAKLSGSECSDPAAVEKFISEAGIEIRKAIGKSDFKQDRLNREQRRALGMDISRRRYNKLFRHLLRMEEKLKKLLRELKKFEFTKIGKSGLASKLAWEEFSANTNTACFIAYYTARCNLRSEFTISGQQRPYDEIADILFQRCMNDTQANWWAIAYIYSNKQVLEQLSESQRGMLLGRWFSILIEVAELLREVWEKSAINRMTMVVRRGNDSSTWNNTASAWNKARMNWIAMLHAMKMDDVLDSICPGKVLRLMAADVAAWHRKAGGQLDPDTAVWNEVPLPWEVVCGLIPCSRMMIEAICRQHGIDPINKGWTAPRAEKHIAEYKPTPELVHGISVSSPQLATVLRKAGWFSGKKVSSLKGVSGAVHVHFDEHGFVVGADMTREDAALEVIDDRDSKADDKGQ
jgi:hypothetical protein